MRGRVWVFAALLVVAAGAGLSARRITLVGFVVLFALGLLTWTIIEYLMHRLAFHGFAPHWQHHADPTNPAHIPAPLWLSLPVAVALFGLFSFLAGSWMTGATVVSGVIAGYLVYEAIHLQIHGPARGGVLLRALRKHHFYHHFVSDQVCFGVTSPLWDLVFGSLPRERQRGDVPVPLKSA